MCGILINAVILIALIKVVGNRETDFLTAGILAFVASVAGFGLAIGLGMVLGIVGIVLAAVLVAGGVGLAVSSLFGIELNRALAIGGLFLVANIGISIALQTMMQTAPSP